jgi:hypothetical protein
LELPHSIFLMVAMETSIAIATDWASIKNITILKDYVNQHTGLVRIWYVKGEIKSPFQPI